jgi:hypothetical protein
MTCQGLLRAILEAAEVAKRKRAAARAILLLKLPAIAAVDVAASHIG